MPQQRPDSVFRRRLVRLLEQLLEARFDGALGIWKLQLNLLRLQQDVQGAITREKKAEPQSQDLQRLRYVLRDCRRLGDAIAWLLLELDRRLVYPLADNQPTPVPPRTVWPEAVIAAAQFMSEQGMGFPILHDITDILRIGDLTFIRQGAPPLTVELKSSVDERQVDDQGVTRIQYAVRATHVDHDVPAETLAKHVTVSTKSDGVRMTGQRNRQFDRMMRARIRSTMPDNVPYELDGHTTISVSAGGNPGRLIPAVNKAIWEARRTGIGHAYGEGMFVFVALHDPEGDVANKTLALLEKVDAGSMLRPILPPGLENGLVVSSIPPPLDKTPERHLPYFLLPLPRRAILDMASGRLAIVVLYNPAVLAQAFEQAGFTVKFEQRPGGAAPAMVFEWTDTSAEGEQWRGEAGGLDIHLREMVMELKSPAYVIDMVKAMRVASSKAARSGQE